MVNVLMPEKFQFGTLFEGLISISGISPITTKIQICYLEVMVLKKIQNLFWYFLLHKRNNANNLHKIACTCNLKYSFISDIRVRAS